MKNTSHLMKRILMLMLLIPIAFQFSSCKKKEDSVTLKWNITIDGQDYSYEEVFSESGESESCISFFQTNAGISGAGGQVLLSSNDGLFTIQIASVNLTSEGTYVFDENTDGLMSIMHGVNAYTTDYGSTTVNITSFPSQTLGAHDNLESTKAKGDFSGTIGDFNGNLHSISGSFEAVRLQ